MSNTVWPQPLTLSPALAQLDDAQHHLSAAKQAARDHPASLQSRVASFGAEQADIHRRLLALTASETSDEAVPRFEAVLDSLQRLDVATAYLELLQQVHVLR